MAFGQQYKKTGQFGAKGIKEMSKLGYTNQEDFLSKNNLNQQSGIKAFGGALKKNQAWQTPPKNINREFEFQGLPEVGANAATQGLRDQTQQLYDKAGMSYDTGNSIQGQGESALTGLLGTTLNEYGERTNLEGQARNRFLDQSQQAIDPTLSGQQQGFLDQGLQTRMGDVNRFYGGASSPGREALAKNLAYNVADLDQLGVGGTSEGATIGTTLSNFNRDYATATQQANELSRGETVAERGRVAGAYDSAAGRNLQDATQQGAMRGQLLGQGRQIGGDLTSSGAQRQALAAELGKLGLSGGAQSLELDMKQRQLEAELQQGEKAFQTDLVQQQIDNERIRRDRRRTNQINNQLSSKYL